MAVHKGIQNIAAVNQNHGTSYMWLYSRLCNYIKIDPAPTKINSNTSRNFTQQTGISLKFNHMLFIHKETIPLPNSSPEGYNR